MTHTGPDTPPSQVAICIYQIGTVAPSGSVVTAKMIALDQVPDTIGATLIGSESPSFFNPFFLYRGWGSYILPPPRVFCASPRVLTYPRSTEIRESFSCWAPPPHRTSRAAPPRVCRRAQHPARALLQLQRLLRPSGTPLLAKAAAAGVGSPFVQQVPSPRGVQLVEFESHGVKVTLPAGTDLGLPGRPGWAWSQ